MDRANIQVYTPPQVVTIGVDPAVSALLTNIHLSLGELVAEQRETNRVLNAMMTANQTWDQTTSALAQALAAPRTAQDVLDGAAMAQYAQATPAAQEGALERATGAIPDAPPIQEATVAAAPAPIAAPAAKRDPADVYRDIENDWFVGQGGAIFIRNGDGTDRRPTAEEQAALDQEMNRPKRTRKGR